MFDKYINSKKDEMLSELSNLISFKSISCENSSSIYPFGEECNKALNYILDLGKKLGFRAKNVDGYCGYIEFGEGNKLVGIIGHLDVVPVSDDWTYNPFKATIIDNKIYGRGAIDDKGPVIASVYAMKAVMDNCKINKRVRLILGLNEEKSWKCINYYKQHEEIPNIGFSPDADFPCIYAEKGILTYFIEENYTKENKTIKIVDFNCNNNALNVVAKYASVTLEADNNININNLVFDIKNLIKKYNYNIEVKNISKSQIVIASYGKSAHSAHPDLGINAISNLIIALNDILEKYNSNIDLFKFFKSKINTEYNGNLLGIDFEDESGNLTLNVGNIEFINNTIKIGLNLRIPVHTAISKVENILNNTAKIYKNINLYTLEKKEPLYINKDSKLIKLLLSIYNKKTNSNLEPIAIGGATYARAFDNCVSFGANMPGCKDMCHQIDEYITIDTLMLSSKIYANAIYELCKM